jgi:hypothetical protein
MDNTAFPLSPLFNPINKTLGTNTAKKAAKHAKNPCQPPMLKVMYKGKGTLERKPAL